MICKAIKSIFNRYSYLTSLFGYIVYSHWDASRIELIFSAGMSMAVLLYLLPFSICLYLGLGECMALLKRTRKL